MGSNPTFPTRICPRCKKEKILIEENFHKGQRQGFQQYCIPCRKQFDAEYWQKNSKRLLNIKKERRQEKIDWYRALKKDIPCVDCKRIFPTPAMHWDHRDPSTKIMAVSTMMQKGYSRNRITDEIAKCDLRCAVCHAIRTHPNE